MKLPGPCWDMRFGGRLGSFEEYKDQPPFVLGTFPPSDSRMALSFVQVKERVRKLVIPLATRKVSAPIREQYVQVGDFALRCLPACWIGLKPHPLYPSLSL
jgi:hypothetical protein